MFNPVKLFENSFILFNFIKFLRKSDDKIQRKDGFLSMSPSIDLNKIYWNTFYPA